MSNNYVKLSVGVVFLWVFSAIPFYAQTDDCVLENGKIVCPIKQTGQDIVGPLTVPNSSKVVVRITEKSPFDDCNFTEIKLTEIKQTDPIITILQLFTKAATGVSLSSATAALAPENLGGTNEEKLLFRDAKILSNNIQSSLSTSQSTITTQGDYTRNDINRLFSVPPRDAVTYGNVVPEVEDKLREFISEPEKSLVAERLRYTLLFDRFKTLLNARGGSVGSDPDEPLALIQEVINTIDGQLVALKTNYDSINAARAQFKLILAFLEDTDLLVSSGKGFQKDLSLLGFSQQAASTTIVCSNSYTKKVTTGPIPVTVLYKDNPKLSVSVGPLLSTIPKQRLGTTPVSTGLNSSGAPTFRTEFAVVDRASYQVIPFAFFNYRIYEFGRGSNPVKPSLFSLHLSAGFGVNPNSGSNEVEYFVGPAIGFKRYLIQFGDHIGRFQKGFNGGFNIGDTVPASFPSALPIRKVYRHGFGIAFSYRLPL